MADTTSPRIQHSMHPITPGATHLVTCTCGAGFDVAALSDDDALEQIARRHVHDGREFHAAPVDYGEHPLYRP
jgi:hypothetical protein